MAADDSHLCADPLVVQAWVTGWALARQTPPPVPEADGLRVDVGWPQQRVRYVFPHCSGRMRCLAETIVEPWIFLKVCAPPAAMRALLPPRWVMQPLGFMMTCASVSAGAAPTLPDGYAFDLSESLPVSIARVLAPDGDVAAIGHVALTGDFAIYDRIETHQGHQRRGLGRAVMKSLEAIAHARGKTRGVLVATADGRALYETLGWRMHSLYTTAVIPAPAAE